MASAISGGCDVRPAFGEYIQRIQGVVEAIERVEAESVAAAAEWVATTIRSGGIVHVFGSGHSALAAKEVFVRAGTLSCIRAIGLDPLIGRLERASGVASTLLSSEDLRSGEVLFLISHSGINPIVVEAADYAREVGLRTVAVTSREHSLMAAPRTGDGRKLMDVADLVIDTHSPAGDASVPVAGQRARVGPLSTLAGIVVMNSVVVEAAGILHSRGVDPPIRMSRNLPEGDQHNRQFLDSYADRIPELRFL